MTIDIGALITFGDKVAHDPGLPHNSGSSITRRTQADVEGVTATVLDDVIALAESRAVDSRGRYWVTPLDFGAVGRSAAGTSVDEHEYVSWALILARLAATKKYGSTANAYSVDVSLAGGYTIGGFLEVQHKQRLFGGFAFLSATSHNGATTFHYLSTFVTTHKGTWPATDVDFVPCLSSAPLAEDWIIEDLEIDGHFYDIAGNRDNASLDSIFTAANGYDTDGLETQFSDSYIGAGISITVANSRPAVTSCTIDNVYVHDTFSGNIVFGSPEASNQATGRIAVGNTVGGRCLYGSNFPNGLERLDVFGFSKTSHCSIGTPSGVCHIKFLHASIPGPFSGAQSIGKGGNPWREIDGGPAVNSTGSVNYLVAIRDTKKHKDGIQHNTFNEPAQLVRVDDCDIDGTDPEGVADVGLACRFYTDLKLHGTVKNCNLQSHQNGAYKGANNSGGLLPVNLDIDITGTDVQPIELAFTDSGCRGMFTGSVKIINAHTDVTEPKDGTPNTDIDPATMDLAATNGTEFNNIFNAGYNGPEISVLKQADTPDDHVQDLYLEYTSDWYQNNLLVIKDLFDGDDNLIPVASVVPTRITLRVNSRTWRSQWLAIPQTTVNHLADPDDLKYYPIWIRLEHPASGRTWNLVAPDTWTGDDAHTIHRDIYYEFNYEGSHNTYRRVYIVSDANKAAANANMQNAGHGANCFSLELTKAAATWWAACFVDGDASLDEFLIPNNSSGFGDALSYEKDPQNIINSVAHGCSDGDAIVITEGTTGGISSVIDISRLYFVVNKDANDFQLSLTPGGAVAPLVGNASGSGHRWSSSDLADALVVSGTGPSGFRDAIVAAGYAVV